MRRFIRELWVVVVVLTWFGLGCGDDLMEMTPTQSPELISYVVDFEILYDVYVDFNVILVDGDIEGNPSIIGFCSAGPHGKPLVRIERTFWQTNNHDRRRAVVFHELGHCALDLFHNDQIIKVKVKNNREEIIEVDGPYSLMHSIVFSERFYQEPFFSDHYIPQMRDEIETQKPSANGVAVCRGLKSNPR